MKVELCLVFTVSVLVSTQAMMLGQCDIIMAGFYKELGCKTSTDPNATSCPESFICPDLHPDPKKCYYRGVAYNDRDMLPEDLVKKSCSTYCTCTTSYNNARFQCADIDCVQRFDRDREQCIDTYDLGSCCSTGTVCGKDDIAKLKTCEVDGHSYKEGQEIYSKNTHKTCLCTGQWNGSFEDPSYCNDINCGIELHFQNMIAQKCAPVFYGQVKACPISFQCPTSSSKVIRGVNVRNINSQCEFGNMTLQVGDEVTVDEKCMKCSCEVPPFLTCVQSPNNYKDNSC